MKSKASELRWCPKCQKSVLHKNETCACGQINIYVDEIKEAKRDLESAIADLIRDFEDGTQIAVSRLEFSKAKVEASNLTGDYTFIGAPIIDVRVTIDWDA